MSKRKTTAPPSARQGSLNPFDDEATPLYSTGPAEEEKRSTRSFRAQHQVDPECIAAALAEIQEFTQFHFLPLAEHLTADHLESFLQQVRKS
jgi:hypothetical protein